ncbi:Oidioi.mRNA.OKI2018_I69.chr1.g3083.t1.cds [Oikopleura dioica]|uniref:Oidioi.mRNA.OKI2018_I69.chr1.g3083.t1.cds n=1 Tax=Oikopleura dioica TaxID=34765 RepID=A0ABN7SSY8_OIKDI|nr:Oidioi.mRNA.OKI2018_I69.chr1.g3083.t1.cds [Oikopleura dioica]
MRICIFALFFSTISGFNPFNYFDEYDFNEDNSQADFKKLLKKEIGANADGLKSKFFHGYINSIKSK